jgi:sterol desaturase/sphingolipid hydroxylase (fatty acid hydroxylase superfamily)
MQPKGSVDRLAIYTPAGGRPGTFARVATVLAASISVGLLVVIAVALLIGFFAALGGALSTSSALGAVGLAILAAVLALVLAVFATGLSIIWRHRQDYEEARRSGSTGA